MTRYAVRSLSGVLVPLAINLVSLAVFVLVIGVAQGNGGFAVAACILAVAYTVPSIRHGRYRLLVDDHGVQLAFPEPGRLGGVARRRSAWPLIHRLEVASATSTVRVVLRADAPLPPWVRGRIVDPSDPESGPSFEHEVAGLDPVAFEQAVRALAPETRVVVGP